MRKVVWKLLGITLLVLLLNACGDVSDKEIYTKEEKDKINSEVSKQVESAFQESEEEKGDTATTEDKESTGAKGTTPATKTPKKAEVKKDKPVEKKPVNTSGTVDKIPVKYVRVVDGDTAKVIYDGQEMSVRYLLIDTPESKHPKVGYQPFGKEASDYNQKLLENAKQVYLEFDVGARTDHYGRLLAYVWADDILINESIVRQGLAVKAYVKPPSTRHLDRIEKAQQNAKVEKKNIWSLNNYVNGEDFRGGSKVDGNKNYPNHIKKGDEIKTPVASNPKPSNPKPSNQKPSNNAESSKPTQSKPSGGGGGQVSHNQPVGSQNENIVATEVFKNCTELRKKYPQGVAKGHPAYASKMDRDKDGYACD